MHVVQFFNWIFWRKKIANSWRIGCNPLYFFACISHQCAEQRARLERYLEQMFHLRLCLWDHVIFRMDFQAWVELNSRGWSWQTSCFDTRVTFFLVCTAWKVGHNGKPKGFLFLANRLCFGVDAESPSLRQWFSGMHVWLNERQMDANCGVLQRDCPDGCSVRQVA